jgi:hypothetical protein
VILPFWSVPHSRRPVRLTHVLMRGTTQRRLCGGLSLSFTSNSCCGQVTGTDHKFRRLARHGDVDDRAGEPSHNSDPVQRLYFSVDHARFLPGMALAIGSAAQLTSRLRACSVCGIPDRIPRRIISGIRPGPLDTCAGCGGAVDENGWPVAMPCIRVMRGPVRKGEEAIERTLGKRNIVTRSALPSGAVSA